MKKSLFLILSLIWSLNLFAGITIVSDLDETIKISNSGSAIGSIKYAFKKSRTFTGIPEFFQGTESYASKVYVISASPKLLHKKISKALNQNGIKHEDVILKRWTKFENRLKYKVREIKELMENSTDDFLLFGDDVGDDPEVYAEIKRLFPGRVLEAYIHLVKNRKVPENVVTHWSTHDIAIKEYLAGRMTSESVLNVINKMKSEKELKYIFPKFAKCPETTAVWTWQNDTEFVSEVAVLNDTLVDYCAK